VPYAPPVRIKADGISGFSTEDIKDLETYILDNIKAINSKLISFRTQKLPEYVRLYKGIPKNMEQDFPWPGAANLVIQLIGTFCDELLSRILGAIYMYDPLFSISLSGDSPDMQGEEMKRVLEKFLMDEAYDPASLDFYRVEQSMFNSAIKYGTGVIHFPWELETEKAYTFISGGSTAADKVEYNLDSTITKRDSPHPKLVPLNKMGIDPKIPVMGDAEFFYTIETLNYWQVKNLPGRNDLYSEKNCKEALETILLYPDRSESPEMQREVQQAQSLESSSDRGSAEWDFYNCFIKYRKGSSTYSILAQYHLKSEKLLYAIYNNNPENIFPVEDVKLSYDDEGYFGTGYAQMLRAYQTELSNNSNWRTNNRNFAMLGIFRVDPDSKLSSILQMYPGVMIPAKEGAVEQIKKPVDVGYSSEADQFIMACAKERAGVDPSTGGTGGGLVNNKRGIYSASGTSMMLIQQNNRNNLRMSDMRSAHVRTAIKLMHLYSNIGIGKKLTKYGDNSETLKKAFQAYKDGSLGFRLRPTTASNNKELERQNDILLSGALSRFYQENAQMLQAMTTQGMPPQLAEYYGQVLMANVALYKTILRNFNHDDISRLVPDMGKILKSLSGGQPQNGNQNVNSSGSNSQTGSNQGAVPVGGFQTSGAVPI
jgi:hypothetical protein